jgi:hypothetical protein
VYGQLHYSAALASGITRYPLYRRLGRLQGWSGQVRKISPPTGILSPDRPTRSELLYRLSYPGPLKILYVKIKLQHKICITTKRYTTIIPNYHFEINFLMKFRYFLRKKHFKFSYITPVLQREKLCPTLRYASNKSASLEKLMNKVRRSKTKGEKTALT